MARAKELVFSGRIVEAEEALSLGLTNFVVPGDQLMAKAEELEALAWLMKALARQYPVTAVAGHEHVAPGRKFDPGPGFDWSHLMAILEWPCEYFPDEVERAAASFPAR